MKRKDPPGRISKKRYRRRRAGSVICQLVSVEASYAKNDATSYDTHGKAQIENMD